MINLPEIKSFDVVPCPQPSEGVKATGEDGASYIINGATATGDVRYFKITDGVRIRHLGGTSTALAVSVAGLDVTVQLATNALSVVTSTANDVVNLINATPAVLLLLNALVGNAPGTGIAGIWTPYMDLSGDIKGSIRPGLQALTNRDRFIAAFLANTPIYRDFKASKKTSTHTLITLNSMKYLGYKDPLGKQIDEISVPAGLDVTAGAYLEGGGSFSALTTYYLYSDSVTSTYQYSTTAPDSSLAFKSGNITKKYLMEIVTGTDASVPEFYRDGSRMYLMRTIGSVGGVSVFSGTIPAAPAESTVSLGTYLPPNAKAVELLFNFNNNTLAVDRDVFVRADGTGTGLKYSITLPAWPQAQGGGVASGMMSERIVIPVDNTGSAAKVYISSSTSAQLVTASVKIVGWIV